MVAQKEEQRKKKAAMNKELLFLAAQQKNWKKREEVANEHTIVNQQEHVIGEYVRSDWTEEVNTTDACDTNLTLQQRLAEDFDLNPDKSDEEDDISSIPHSKRGLSPPVDPSPSKLFKQSESPNPVQLVKQDQAE